MPEGGIVDRDADVDIIGYIKFGDGGIVNGIDDAIVGGHDVTVDVDEVGTGSIVVVTIEKLLSATCRSLWAITNLFPEVTNV